MAQYFVRSKDVPATDPRPSTNQDVEFLRIVAIFLVMMIHVPHVGDFLSADIRPNASFVLTVLNNGFGRVSAPLIGGISGYFCIAILDKKGTRGFLGKKVSSLIYPLVFWNLAALALLLALNMASGGEQYKWEFSLPEIIGLTTIPVNIPLHYLADLFKCCIILGLLQAVSGRLALSRVATSNLVLATGVVLYLAITFAGVTGHPRFFRVNEADPRILFRPDLAVFFFLGAWLALRGMRLHAIFDAANRRIGYFGLASLLVALVCLSVLAQSHLEPLPEAGRDLGTRMVGALLLLTVVARLAASGHRLDVPRRVTFRSFCSHPLVYILLALALQRLGFDPGANPQSALVACLVFPVVAVMLAWLSLHVQDRLAQRGPRRIRHVIRAIP